jgi:hypothetical protein
VAYSNYNDNSNANADDEPKCNYNSDTNNNPRSNNNVLFNSKDNRSVNSAADKDIDKYGGLDSSYNSNRTDVTITQDTDKCYTTKLNECRQPLY